MWHVKGGGGFLVYYWCRVTYLLNRDLPLAQSKGKGRLVESDEEPEVKRAIALSVTGRRSTLGTAGAAYLSTRVLCFFWGGFFLKSAHDHRIHIYIGTD